VNIAYYTEWVKLLLGEFGRYFFLVLFLVLAIRLWRRFYRLSGHTRKADLFLACLATAVTGTIGYFSICHSLGLLYSRYGMDAFNRGNLAAARTLFHTSYQYQKNPDTLGMEGICLLWLDAPAEGMPLIDQANTMRHGRNTAREEYYEGLYFYFHEQSDRAVPLLEASSPDPAYHWNITKLFAVINLEKNQPDEARRLLQPFAQVPVDHYDHAYIIAALDLADGRTNEARALVERFDATNLPAFWKSRFEKLRAKVHDSSR